MKREGVSEMERKAAKGKGGRRARDDSFELIGKGELVPSQHESSCQQAAGRYTSSLRTMSSTRAPQQARLPLEDEEPERSCSLPPPLRLTLLLLSSVLLSPSRHPKENEKWDSLLIKDSNHSRR